MRARTARATHDDADQQRAEHEAERRPASSARHGAAARATGDAEVRRARVRRNARAHGASDAESREAVATAATVRHWSTVLNGMAVDFEAFKAELGR